ncbi:MAG TPA: zinc-dependent alcohol dehydrogenase family protein [Anaeromyxobacteraceae bacterium]|nr:zinc-dependent alcohol dehydrogenase family protein [Anaeromyxobacteraceae bacterium]
MRSMVLRAPGQPLTLEEGPDPAPGPRELLLDVRVCGVCRTDLHVVDGELPHPKRPLVPGHEVVGRVLRTGSAAVRFKAGDRVGMPWLGSTCGECEFCRSGRENLCEQALFTGYQLDGGYADRAVVDERFALALPASFGDAEAAPLLCAGLIGYRAWQLVRDARRLGLYGFGAAAHIVVQFARHAGQEVLAFVRPGDREASAFALKLGASWAGGSDEAPPRLLDAAILFAPVGALVPAALRCLRKGGAVVCAGIHMSDIPSFPYALLWGERAVRSVANLTRRDGEEFLSLAPRVPIRTEVVPYPLVRANEALSDLRAGRLRGAAVLVP